MKQTPPHLIAKGFMLKMPGMMSCETFNAFLLDYFDDTLPPATRKSFERHVKVCRACKSFLAQYESMLEQTSSLNAQIPLPNVPEDLVQAVLAAQN